MNNKNKLLYAWQGIACIMILQMHVSFPGKCGEMLIILGKFSVCLFFAISGFFLSRDGNYVSINVIKRKVMKLLKYFMYAFIAYLAYRLVLQYFTDGRIVVDGIKELGRLLLFNKTNSISVGILWFMPALIYVYLLYWIIQNISEKNKYKIMITLSILSLVVSYVARVYAVVLDQENDYYNCIYMFRNWFGFGLPMFTLGVLLRKYEGRLKKISTKNALTIILLGFMLEILEAYIIRLGVDFYIGSIVIVIGIFALVQREMSNRILDLLSILGEKYALFIYLWHVLVMYLLILLMDKFSLRGMFVNGWTLPIIVFIITLTIAILIEKIKEKINGISNT